jgi:hypothetical protein
MPELSYFDLVFKSLDASCDVSRFHSTEQELDDFFLITQPRRLTIPPVSACDTGSSGNHGQPKRLMQVRKKRSSGSTIRNLYKRYPGIANLKIR